jgi:hypothetical protein
MVVLRDPIVYLCQNLNIFFEMCQGVLGIFESVHQHQIDAAFEDRFRFFYQFLDKVRVTHLSPFGLGEILFFWGPNHDRPTRLVEIKPTVSEQYVSLYRWVINFLSNLGSLRYLDWFYCLFDILFLNFIVCNWWADHDIGFTQIHFLCGRFALICF